MNGNGVTRIALVGNCQARPLGRAMQLLVPDLEITTTAIVHLLKDADDSEYAPRFEAADFVIAQLVNDKYPCAFVRTNVLKERYGERVHAWPNLFYSGYNPEMTYLRRADRRPRTGPLGDYHLRTIVDGWRQRRSVDDVVEAVQSVDANRELFRSVPRDSLAELRAREAVADIEIVDWIEHHQWQHRLFFTFNHPTWRLIEQTALQLLGSIGLDVGTSDLVQRFPWAEREPLGQFRAPINAWVAAEYPLSFEDEIEYRGSTVPGFGRPAEDGRGQLYGLRDLVAAYYRGYDEDPDGLT